MELRPGNRRLGRLGLGRERTFAEYLDYMGLQIGTLAEWTVDVLPDAEWRRRHRPAGLFDPAGPPVETVTITLCV